MSFQYTSGDPTHLTGGANASMADIQGPFTDLKTFLNGRIAAIPTLVSSLPGAPVDGQEIYYQADATNGIIWHLRYRSASASAYKWEFVGGGSMRSEVVSPTAPNGNSAWFVLTGGPSVTVPLAGDYEVRLGANLGVSNAGKSIQIGIMLAGASVTNSDEVLASPTTLTGWTGTLSATAMGERKVTAAASNIVAMGYFTNDWANITVQKTFLALRPIRVG